MGRLLKPDGKRIRALRVSKGWPREQLAQIAAVRVGTIRTVEAGGTASFEALRAIAGAFGLEVHELMQGLPGMVGRSRAESGRLLRLLSAEAVAASVAWWLPYAPAAKGLMATFAMIVLAVSAIALSPLLVDLDEDSIIVASSQSLSPAPTLVPAKVAQASVEPQMQRPAAFKAASLRASRPGNTVQPADKGAPATEIKVSPKIPARAETPPAERGNPPVPLHAAQPAGAVQAIAGVIHTDWLKNLAQPVSIPGNFAGQARSQAAPASVVAIANRGGGGGYSVLGRPFVRSGKTTAAFFAKVGTSIKRAF